MTVVPANADNVMNVESDGISSYIDNLLFSLPNVNLQKGNDIINLESASFSNGHINGGPDYDIINLNPSKDYSSDITLNDGCGGFFGNVNSSFSNIEEINTGIGYDN